MANRFPDVKNPMDQFRVGEHVDRHGRRVLFRLSFRFCGDGHFSTWMRWQKYL